MKKYQSEIIIATAYLAASFGLSLFKYLNFLYPQLDLAIFINALRQPWGHALWSTIQGHHYFGDHFAPYLILFKPFLDLFRSPLIILFLQCLIIALTVIPLSGILKKIFGEKSNWKIPLLILFFANPITFGINLYEFHPEVILLPLLFSTFYFYQSKNFKFFALFFGLAMIVREDAVLALLPFSVLAILEKRDWKWKMLPLISIPYAYLALKVVAHFNPTGQSIFLKYYSWLGGNGAPQIIFNALTHPLAIAAKLFSASVLEFLFAALMLTFFLPAFKPKYLIFSILPYLSLAMGPVQGVTLLHSHYAIGIFFGMILASYFGAEKIIHKHEKLAKEYRPLILLIGSASLLYFIYVMGPLNVIVKHLRSPLFGQEVRDAHQALKNIDLNQPTLSSYDFLPEISSPDAYLLGYALEGHQQMSLEKYPLPTDLPQMIIDSDDFINIQLKSTPEKYAGYVQKMAELLKDYRLSYADGRFLVFKRKGSDEIANYSLETKNTAQAVKITYYEDDGTIINHQYYPLIFWQMYKADKGFEKYKAEIVELEGYHVLDNLGSIRRIITSVKIISTIHRP